MFESLETPRFHHKFGVIMAYDIAIIFRHLIWLW